MKNTMFKLIICISILLLMKFNMVFAESIYLKDGTFIKGTIIKSDENSVTIRTSYGESNIPKEQIKKIEYIETTPQQKKQLPTEDSIKVDIEKPVHVKLEKTYKHYLIAWIMDFLDADGSHNYLDPDEKALIYNTFTYQYFPFPDASIGVDCSVVQGFLESKWSHEKLILGSGYVSKDANVDVLTTGYIFNIVGTKYFTFDKVNCYIGAKFGAGPIEINSKTKLESENVIIEEKEFNNKNTLAQFMFRLGANYGGEVIFLGIHLNYASKTLHKFKMLAYKTNDPDPWSLNEYLEEEETEGTLELGGGVGFGFFLGIKF